MMILMTRTLWLTAFAAVLFTSGYSDVIITKNGDELQGKVVSVNDSNVVYSLPASDGNSTLTLERDSVFMIKYDDGRKDVLAQNSDPAAVRNVTDGLLYSASIVCKTGLFGLININEQQADFGIFIIGLTPSFERRVNRNFSAGGEFMLLWADIENASESRFIMNANAYGKLLFPLSASFLFTTQIGAGLSYWPGSDATYTEEATLFKERVGWDFHGGIGLEYSFCKYGSVLLFTGYNANFTMLDEIPITIDMLSISLGPVFRF